MPIEPPPIGHKITISSQSEKSWVFTNHEKQVTTLKERGSHQKHTPINSSWNKNQNNQQTDNSLLPLTPEQISQIKIDATH